MDNYKLEKGWTLDFNQKIISKKPIPVISWIATSLGLCRTSVSDLYKTISRTFSTAEFMKYSLPIEHDNFVKPPNYPYYFRLINGWRIDERSVKFLKAGPIFSENGTRVIVTEKIFIKTILSRSWEFITAIGVILGILGSLLAIYQFSINIEEAINLYIRP